VIQIQRQAFDRVEPGAGMKRARNPKDASETTADQK